MKMRARALVMGVTQFNDTIDGQMIEANNVFLVVDMAATAGKGQRTAQRKAEKAVIDAFVAIPGLTFPVECDIEFTEVATRAKESSLITAMQPVAQRKAA